MKKLATAFTAVAAFTAPALAADMAVKAPMRAAAPVAYAPTWSGCYIGGGGGYGMWNQENTTFRDTGLLGLRQLSDTTTTGGRGGFGTVQVGCDYQFNLLGYNAVIGGFGDYDFSSLKGQLTVPGTGLLGQEKMSSAWAAGGRLGVVLFPNLMTYVSGGWTEAKFDSVNFTTIGGLSDSSFLPIGVSADRSWNQHTYKGWFIGTGDEYALNFLPGLFWKTEYRLSRFDAEINPLIVTSTGLRGLDSVDSKKWVQTIRSELVYRFNWDWGKGPVTARY
jgi:outer membrane immunogenic protein